tara:strand:+ start:11951 stop:12385 length:435 start_codon:yes stop_codon:yes gene_type:complete
MSVSIYDAETQNTSDRNAQKYKDLDLFFKRVTSTKDVNKLTDITAVKRSVRNLILTNHYEKPFHPEIGSGVRDLLFEPMTPVTANYLMTVIEDTINNFEPRADLISVKAVPDLDRNNYEVSIQFYIINIPSELIDLSIFLEVLR